ncbi:hypothetical protein [Legionella sp.]|uniref:hypothetical protein n=1 Tax=Legionella sp. TaxID=459 RepID=UPI00321FAAF0
MPRYTAVAISNPNYRTIRLTYENIAQRLRAGHFSHNGSVDFEQEHDVLEVLLGWTQLARIKHIIVSYELLDNNNYQILSFRSLEDESRYTFQEPLTFASEYNEIMGARMMRPQPTMQPLGPTAVTATLVNAPVNINGGQSTHTASVHKSVTESLQRLDCRYPQININNNIEAIKEFSKKINAQTLPNTSELERKAAIRFIRRMDTLFDNKESGANLTIKHILALIWEGMHDEKTGALKCDRQTAEESFVKHLYEIQRGYNLDLTGKDMGGEDKSICAGGTINKLTDTLNGGMHADVEIIYITKETAGEKLKALVKERVVAFIQNSPHKAELITQIDNLKTADELPTWDIPDLILNTIKDDVKKSFYAEFQNSLSSVQLEEIFIQYEYTSLDQTNYKQLNEEKIPANIPGEMSSEKADVEEVSVRPEVNISQEVPEVINRETTNKEKTAIPQENVRQPGQSLQMQQFQHNRSEPLASVNRGVQSPQQILEEVTPQIHLLPLYRQSAETDQSIVGRIFRFFGGFNPSSVCQAEDDLPRVYKRSQ